MINNACSWMMDDMIESGEKYMEDTPIFYDIENPLETTTIYKIKVSCLNSMCFIFIVKHLIR